MAKISPFTGPGRRLDGKPLTQSAAPASSAMLKQHQPEAQNGTKYSKSSNPASRQPTGRLVFGSNGNKPEKEAPKVCLSCLVIKLPQFFFFFFGITGAKTDWFL